MLKSLAFLLLLLAPSLSTGNTTYSFPNQEAQEQEKPKPAQEEDKQEKPSVLDEMDDMMGGDDQMQELIDLFHEVERALIDIDDQLYEAGATGKPSSVQDSGLVKLLRSTQDQSKSVIQGIDRILEVASQMNASQSSGSGSKDPSTSESPLNSERDKGPQQREHTPEAPDQKKEGQGAQPEPQEKEEEGKKPEQKGEKPSGADNSNEKGENKQGQPKNKSRGERQPRSDEAGRWGELPQRVQDTFRTQGRDDLPAQYRDWIDAYYKRLNRRR